MSVLEIHVSAVLRAFVIQSIYNVRVSTIGEKVRKTIHVFFQGQGIVREFDISQGIFRFQSKVREMSENFEKTGL